MSDTPAKGPAATAGQTSGFEPAARDAAAPTKSDRLPSRRSLLQAKLAKGGLSPNRYPLREAAEYAVARLGEAGLSALPIDLALHAADSLGRTVFRIAARHRERATANLRQAFPDRTEAECSRLAQAAFGHFFRLLVESMRTPRLIHPDGWHRRVTLPDTSRVAAVLASGRPVIMISGHLGNWEAMGSVLAVMGLHVHAVARPIDNRLINRWLRSVREKRGLRIIEKWDRGGVDGMTDTLRGGGVLGVIADQNAGDHGLFVPFFNRLASTHKSVALLAIQQQATIICGYLQRRGVGARFAMRISDIIEPTDWAMRDDPLFYITARFMHAIESMVRESPEQYMWMHRRWKSRPRFEKRGKPMPASLRRNLLSLPWVDEAAVQRMDVAAGR